MRTKKEELNDYSVVIKIGSDVFESSAPTIPEALEKIKMVKFCGKITAMIKHGENTCNWELIRPALFKKVLDYPEHKLLFEKRAKQLLGEIK